MERLLDRRFCVSTIVTLLFSASLWSMHSAETLPNEWQQSMGNLMFIRHNFCKSQCGGGHSSSISPAVLTLCEISCRTFNEGTLTLCYNDSVHYPACIDGIQYQHCRYADAVVCSYNDGRGSCIYPDSSSIPPACVNKSTYGGPTYRPVTVTPVTRVSSLDKRTTTEDNPATLQETRATTMPPLVTPTSDGQIGTSDGQIGASDGHIGTPDGHIGTSDGTTATGGHPADRTGNQLNLVAIVLGAILGVALLTIVLVIFLRRRGKTSAKKTSNEDQQRMDMKENVDSRRVHLAERTETSDHTHDNKWRVPDSPRTGEPAKTGENITRSDQERSKVTSPQWNEDYQALTADPQVRNYTTLNKATEASKDTGEALNVHDATATEALQNHHYFTLNETPEEDAQHAYSEVVPVSGRQSKDQGNMVSAYDHLAKPTGSMKSTSIPRGTMSEYDHPRNMSASESSEGVTGQSQKPPLASPYASVNVV